MGLGNLHRLWVRVHMGTGMGIDSPTRVLYNLEAQEHPNRPRIDRDILKTLKGH
jgi:hypothetical protein